MKNFLILILICFAQNTSSQTIPKGNSTQKTEAPVEYLPSNTEAVIEDDNQVYNYAGIEVRPEFPGGLEALNGFIKQNYNNPQPGLKGKVYVTFIIEKDGSLSHIQVLRDLDLGHETGAEAIKVLQLAPKWSPGKQNNKIIRVLFSMPILVDL